MYCSSLTEERKYHVLRIVLFAVFGIFHANCLRLGKMLLEACLSSLYIPRTQLSPDSALKILFGIGEGTARKDISDIIIDQLGPEAVEK